MYKSKKSKCVNPKLRWKAVSLVCDYVWYILDPGGHVGPSSCTNGWVNANLDTFRKTLFKKVHLPFMKKKYRKKWSRPPFTKYNPVSLHSHLFEKRPLPHLHLFSLSPAFQNIIFSYALLFKHRMMTCTKSLKVDNKCTYTNIQYTKFQIV